MYESQTRLSDWACARARTHTHTQKVKRVNSECSHHKKIVFSFSFYCISSISHKFIFIVYEMIDANCTCFGNHFTIYMSIHYAVYWRFPNFLAPGTSSGEDNIFFPMDWQGNSLGMFQGHYIYCALYFYYYYYISSTSDHQALDLGGGDPCCTP